jgi:hypothetical protein
MVTESFAAAVARERLPNYNSCRKRQEFALTVMRRRPDLGRLNLHQSPRHGVI